MTTIIRKDGVSDWAHSGIIKAGDYYFVGYCSGNDQLDMKGQAATSLDELERKLKLFDLSLENVVQLNALLLDIWEIPIMEEVFKSRFLGDYPVRKSIQTNFAHQNLRFQCDAICYKSSDE